MSERSGWRQINMIEFVAAILITVGFCFLLVGMTGFVIGGTIMMLCGLAAGAYAVLQ